MLKEVILFFGLVSIGFAYLYLAKRLNIVDKPNHRSSHTKVTVRGGGIIFPIAAVIWWGISGFQDTFMILGLVLISLISFWDDIHSLSRKFRFLMQSVALSLGFYQLDLFSQMDWYILPIFYFIALGIINAINFMDGINGISGLYGLVFFSSLLAVQSYLPIFQSQLIQYEILAICVFLLFNLRKRALMFAGDVGSISLAYLIIYFLTQWYLEVGKWTIILLLLVYGVDVVLTMARRYRNGEKLSEPHRTHLYQILANEFKISHVLISLGYASLQLLINYLFFIQTKSYPSPLVASILLIGTGIAYLLFRHLISSRLSPTDSK
ncbi:glycosyltransferase family 4 protein [Algoriphagus kandeliae]|uniref:Glycosyltransferase family 4 protein n=1 Tax=Algoriphagus kandeliae TaxID=2562278 RepID=A0A4Y9QYW7_9BACT|nr:glycosyltransferase family 4 protein [Algoriphagus kandeliae]TFV97240.1 glycosyltransferase family 4 protein [Algoriphagus kandeliae]